MNPKVVTHDFGPGWIEGYFRLTDLSAWLTLHSGIPEATIRARIIEASGYCLRPPRSGDKIMLINSSMIGIDGLALAAMKRVIFSYVPEREVDEIVHAYLAEPMGDAHNISYYFDGDIHWMVITAVLDVLQDRGRLPRHESWG